MPLDLLLACLVWSALPATAVLAFTARLRPAPLILAGTALGLLADVLDPSDAAFLGWASALLLSLTGTALGTLARKAHRRLRTRPR